MKTLGPLIGNVFDSRAVKPPATTKQTDPFYLTPEYRLWREQVIARAGRRCEDNDGGRRCTKAEPAHRMFADHVIEVRDGGAAYDPANGKCLCGRHHSLKTAAERSKRMGSITRG